MTLRTSEEVKALLGAKNGSARTLPPLNNTRGRIPKKKADAATSERDKGDMQSNIKRRIKVLLSDNQDLSEDEIVDFLINDESVKSMAKGDPLEGIKKGLENYITIHELKDIIGSFKNNPNKPTQEQQQQQQGQGDMDMSFMMPFFNNMQGAGFDVSKMSPEMLWLNMFNQGQNANPAMQKMAMNMMMTKMMMGQQNNSPNGNGQNPQTSPNITVDLIEKLQRDFQDVMQSQQQKPQYNPMDMMMYQNMMKGQNGNGELSQVLAKMNEISVNNRTNEMAQMQMNMQQFQAQQNKILANALYAIKDNGKDPKTEFFETLSIAKELMGDGKSKTDLELKYGLEVQKLEHKKWEKLQEQSLISQQAAREHEKSMAYVNLGSNLLGGNIAEMIGGIASSVSTAKQGASKKKIGEPTGISSEDLDLL